MVAGVGVIVGVEGAGLIVTLIVDEDWHPAALVIVRWRSVVPEAPAVYVTLCPVVEPWVEPLVIDQAYVMAPAGPEAELPATLGQRDVGIGVIVGPSQTRTFEKARLPEQEFASVAVIVKL